MVLVATQSLAYATVPGDDPSGSDAPLREVEITSSVDGTTQVVMVWVPDTDKPTPLLVALHTWSGDFRQANPRDQFWGEAKARGWAFIHPDFRGPSNTPHGCASELAIVDVLDAVTYAKQHANIDDTRIYLVGSSGGGHMALQMVGAAPEVWAGVSAWVPITDLAAWHAFHTRDGTSGKYARHIEAACGGPPGASAAVDAQYRDRSPIHHLSNAAGLPVDINAGIYDGHRGSVPIDHSLRAFNVLAEANGHPEMRLSAEEMAHLVEHATIPPGWAETLPDDAAQPRRYAVLLRRTAGPARLTLFDGGHTQDPAPAVAWLAAQRRVDPSEEE